MRISITIRLFPQERLDNIRNLTAAIQQHEIELRAAAKELSDEEVLKVRAASEACFGQ
jgi:uncharacterized protein YqeY